jgi:N-acyl-D-aspartate/D-glutamate deacylase
MMNDVIVRGVSLVDGTGAPARVTDVAWSNGRITSVDAAGQEAAEVIDGTGLVLAPGVIDPHTHYDAQLLWDPTASPSNLHGVTTVISGNCGFTLAPLSAGDDGYLKAMMAKVEGMSLAALEATGDWPWDGFDQYLDLVDRGLGVNAAFMVGHCALRRRVMGPASVGAEATPEQIDEMVAMLHRAIEAGGIGFSTTLSPTHSDGDGQPVASRWASEDELLALARAVGEHPGTQLEFASDGCLNGFDDAEIDFMIRFAQAADRPLNWNVLTVDSAKPERSNGQLAAMERCHAAGVNVVALTMPIIVGMNMSFKTFCALNLLPDWGQILGLPKVARLACLRDPDVRAWMRERAAAPEAGVFSRLTGWEGYVIGDTSDRSVYGRRVDDIAAERGVSSFDALLDVVIADDLETVLWPSATDDDDASWAMRAEAWKHPAVMIGGSDAGAHLDRMCGSPYPTIWLGDCIRGRKLTSMEDAIRHMTQRPAELFGMTDRGVVRDGAIADVWLFDPATVGAGPVHMVNDLPADAPRLMAKPEGVHGVWVAGERTVADGEETAARPGKVLRSGADTHN